MTLPQPAMTLQQPEAENGEFAVLDWDRRFLEAILTEADREQERNFWRHAGLVPRAARLGAFVQREAREDGLSVYSDGNYHLLARVWYSCEVQTALERVNPVLGCDVDSEAFDLSDCKDKAQTFHGTTFKNLISILQAGGLRAGPNGHSKNGRPYKGVFQSANLGEAFLRADQRKAWTRWGSSTRAQCLVCWSSECPIFGGITEQGGMSS